MGLRFLFKFQGFKLAEVNFIHTCGLAATGSAWSSCIQWPAYDILLHRHVQKLKPIQQDAAINCSTHQFISIHLSNTSAHYFHLSNASKLLDAFPHGRLHIFGAPAGGNPKVSALGIWTAAVRRTRWATRHRGITLRWIFEGKGHLGPGQTHHSRRLACFGRNLLILLGGCGWKTFHCAHTYCGWSFLRSVTNKLADLGRLLQPQILWKWTIPIDVGWQHPAVRPYGRFYQATPNVEALRKSRFPKAVNLVTTLRTKEQPSVSLM